MGRQSPIKYCIGRKEKGNKLIDKANMLSSALSRFTDQQKKTYESNIKHAENTLSIANDELKQTNDLARQMLRQTLDTSQKMLLSKPSQGGEKRNKTHRKRKTGRKLKTRRNRNIRRNRKTRRKLVCTLRSVG